MAIVSGAGPSRQTLNEAELSTVGSLEGSAAGLAAEATRNSCPRALLVPVALEMASEVDTEDLTAAGLAVAVAEVVVVSGVTLAARATEIALDPQVAHLPAQDLIDATATAAFRDPASIREDLDALTTGLAANVKVAGLATATADDGPAVTWNRLGVVTVVGIATGEETATATETATVIGIGEAGIVATMIGRERMTTGSEPTKEEGTTIPGKCLVTNPCANTYWTAAPIPAW